jgi:hypothetical protein
MLAAERERESFGLCFVCVGGCWLLICPFSVINTYDDFISSVGAEPWSQNAQQARFIFQWNRIIMYL